MAPKLTKLSVLLQLRDAMYKYWDITLHKSQLQDIKSQSREQMHHKHKTLRKRQHD